MGTAIATRFPLGIRADLTSTFDRAVNMAKSTDITSATTTDIGAATGNYVQITGTTTITGLGTSAAGVWRNVTFVGALILTYNATSLILPSSANITTVAGDTAIFVSEGSGNWRCLSYQRRSGSALVGGAGGDASTNTATSVVDEITLFADTSGKLLKRAAISGTPFLTSGVLSAGKVTLTQPATGSTLTIADGKTLTASNTLTFTGTDSSSVAFGAGGTVLYNGGALGTPSSVTLTNGTGLPISTGVSGLGTSVATALAVNVGSAGSVVLNGGALGTPSSGTLTNATGLPVSTGITGLGTSVATALAVAVGSAGAFVTFNGALGTPSSATLTNATGLPISSGVSGLAANIATFLATPSSANLLAAITDETGTGSVVFANTPTLVTPVLGVATATSIAFAQSLNSSATLTTAATTADQVLLSISATTYRSIEFVISILSSTNYHVIKGLIIHDGTSASHTQFGDIFTGASLTTINSDVNGGNVRLLITPTNAVTTYRITYRAIAA
jgi:hypothetical protein